eukprot:jgi/Chlat1/7107/Chrsp57S06789
MVEASTPPVGDGPPQEFLADAWELADMPGTADMLVQSFTSKYPIAYVLDALQHCAAGDEVTICAALKKILALNVAVLPSLMPFAAAGLQSSSPSVQRLACEQIRALVKHIPQDEASSALDDASIPVHLIDALTSEDSGVGAEASRALEAIASMHNGLALVFTDETRMKFASIANGADSTVRVRLVALASAIASSSSDAAQAVQRAGLFNALARDLADPRDHLAVMTSLDSVADVLASPSSDCEQPLRVQAIKIAGRILSKQDGATDTPEGLNQLASCLVSALENGNSSGDIVEAAVDALGEYAGGHDGADRLLTQTDVVKRIAQEAFRNSGDGRQLTACHALASIAGSERMPEPQLSVAAEETLCDAVYGACGASTPAAWFNKTLQQPFGDFRIAVYRLIYALAVRQWAAAEICHHAELLERILDASTETGQKASDWRFACVESLLRGASSGNNSMLQDAVDAIRASIRRGKYGQRQRVEAVPTVMTEMR